MKSSLMRSTLAVALVLLVVAGVAVIVRTVPAAAKNTVVAYFANSNGIFPGDEVRILGVAVGTISSIEPEPDRAKITFTYDDKYPVPADVNAVMLSPSLVTARAIQLTPAYTSGPRMTDNAVIPLQRTAVPVEFDDLRKQLERLTDALQPTEPGGVSTLGAFVNTAADNLRGNGSSIRDAIIKLSAAFSALGDNSSDLFSTVKNLSILVSALESSQDLMRQLNVNLASTTSLLGNGPDELGQAIQDINDVVGDVTTFVADNRESVGTTADKLSSLTNALNESRDDIEQVLHVAPNAFQNFVNIYQPAQGTLTGALAFNNFANPVDFLCSGIQAASRLGAEQSAKLCVQYLAPILKNRQYNFPPLGGNLAVGVSARPNELTYSEEWLRPNYLPPQPQQPAQTPPVGGETPTTGPLLAAEAPISAPAADPAQPVPTDPNQGLTGMMMPPEGQP